MQTGEIMKHCFEEYCSKVNEVNSLVRHQIDGDLPAEEIVKTILVSSERIYELKNENDSFLQNDVFSKRAEELTEEEAASLFEFAEYIYRKGALDVGVAYKIHCKLYDYYHKLGDTDKEIRELYYMGLTLNTLYIVSANNNINTSGEKLCGYFCGGADFIKDYETFKSEETRAFIIRCLGNRKFGDPLIKGNGNWRAPTVTTEGYKYYRKLFDEAMGIIKSDYYRKLNPDIPWDVYEYAMHYDRTVYLTNLRMMHEGKRKTDEYERMANDVLESAEYVYNTQSEKAAKNFMPIGDRNIYVYAAAKFHAGRISAYEMVDTLFKASETADPSDYSSGGMFSNIGLTTYAHHYMNYLSTEEKKQIEPRYNKALRHTINYITNFRNTSTGDMLGAWIAELMNEQAVDDKSFRADAMRYIIYCHPPTYVHSHMVAFLSKIIFSCLVETAPEVLLGVFGVKSVEELIKNKDKYAERAFRCGLYHDIGKNQVISYISIYARRLLDEEFEAIKYHTVMGYYMLKQYPDLDVEAEVALRHHRRFDNKGGYPDMCEDPPSPESKPMIDIVTVADCLDAATDNIGRSYSAAKTVEQLVDELRQASGTRYNPDVVKVFDDEEFLEELKTMVDTHRKEVYCDAYSMIKWNDDVFGLDSGFVTD